MAGLAPTGSRYLLPPGLTLVAPALGTDFTDPTYLCGLRKSLRGTQQWSQEQAADKGFSLFSQQQLKCQCLVLARPSTELTTPSGGDCGEGAG